MNEDYRPKLSFEISENQKQRLDKLITTYGMRKAILSIVLDDILDLIEQYGGVAIGILMSKRVRPRDILPQMKEAEERGKR